MKIVHILFNLYLGGAEVLLLDIMREQVRMEHDVTLVLINDDHDKDLLSQIDPRVNVKYINRPAKSKNPYYIFKLNVILWRLNPNVVHTHNDTIWLLYKKNGVKYVGTVHSVGVPYTKLNRWDKIFAVSSEVKNYLQHKYGVDSKIIYNGIYTSSIKQKDYKSNHIPFRIVQIGRLIDVKGCDILIRAIRRVIDSSDTEIRVDFIGDGILYEKLSNLIKQLKLENYVRLLGALNRNELYERICEYDLLAVTSRVETFGLTIAEAMAAKVPVLVPNLNGPMDVVSDGKYGTIFVSEDENDCADKIIEIINNYSKYLELAQTSAYENVLNKFDLKKIVEQYVESYK